MSLQDWETVTFSKNYTRAGTSSTSSSASGATSGGAASTEPQRTPRFIPPGYNSQSSVNGANFRKIEDDTDNFGSPKTVNTSLSRTLADARNAKRWTQKQLASEINETVSVIQSYENGSAIPNPNILNKLDKALGIHLPRNKKK